MVAGQQLLEDYNFDGIELVLPTTLFDARYELNLEGKAVHLIYVGPCHQVGDTIIHLPEERVVSGDVLFRQCTPMGWTGSYDKWFKCLDLVIELDPEVIVPGHGPLCGIEGAMEMKAYLQYMHNDPESASMLESRHWKPPRKSSLGRMASRAPARLYMNVERAYRESSATNPLMLPGTRPRRLMRSIRSRKPKGSKPSSNPGKPQQRIFS